MQLTHTLRTLPFAHMRGSERTQHLEEVALLGTLIAVATLMAPYVLAVANQIAAL